MRVVVWSVATSLVRLCCDHTNSGSYDWLRLGLGATDRQCFLRFPGAVVAFRDQSLRVVELSGKIGEHRW